MEGNETLICRLCLEACDSGAESVEDTIQETLNLLLLNIDLAISNEPVVCPACLDSLKICYGFKVKYLDKENSASSVSNSDIKPNTSGMNISSETNTVNDCSSSICSCCVFCAQSLEEGSVLLKNDDRDMLLMMGSCKLGLCTSEKLTCLPCYDSLQHYSSFINNCWNVEEKIRNYCIVEGTNAKGQIELNTLLDFTSKHELHNLSACNSFDAVKKEEIKDEEEDEVKKEVVKVEEHMVAVDQDEDIKNVEQHDHERCEDDAYGQQPEPNCVMTNEKHSKIYSCNICVYKSNRGRNLQRHNLIHMKEASLYKCKQCVYSTKLKKWLLTHMRTHEDVTDVQIYKCKKCDFETKLNDDFNKHLQTHNDTIHECKMCKVRFKGKRNLRSHVLVFHNTSKVTLYKCDQCLYQTVWKSSFRGHALTHKTAAEVTMYKCEFCPHQNKRMDMLMRHMQVHKNSSEVTTYPCTLCEFRSRYKHCLKNHMLTHKTISEVPTFKCDVCEFQTKRKGDLQRHMLTHKSKDAVTMYQCDFCAYQAMRKSNVRIHMLTHTSVPEPALVKRYKCEYCPFSSKRKHDLSRHVLTHKDASEVVMYKCEMCAYKARRKSNLERHLRSHKDVTRE